MKMIFRSFCLLLILMGASLSTKAAPDLERDLMNIRPVDFGEGKSRQVFSKLKHASLPSLHTQIIYPANAINPKESKGIVILLPGTSANTSSEFGLMQSLGPLANQILKKQFTPLAFQPPIYDQANESAEQRAPLLEKFSNLESNLDWLAEILKLAASLARDGQKLYLIGRSTFAAVSLEALHRYAQNDSRFEIISKFKSFGVFGLDGHTRSEIDAWHSAEVEYYFQKHPEKADPAVVLAAPQIFSEMRHQTEISTTARPSPEVFVAFGSRDEFCNGCMEALLKPILGFKNNHPNLSINLVRHDGYHDISRAIPDARAQTMARTKVFLDLLFGNTQLDQTSGSQLKIHFIPDEESVLDPLSTEQRTVCSRLLNSN